MLTIPLLFDIGLCVEEEEEEIYSSFKLIEKEENESNLTKNLEVIENEIVTNLSFCDGNHHDRSKMW
jgi:hypothetical protein